MGPMSSWVTLYGRTVNKVNSKLGSTMKILMIGVNTPILIDHLNNMLHL